MPRLRRERKEIGGSQRMVLALAVYFKKWLEETPCSTNLIPRLGYNHVVRRLRGLVYQFLGSNHGTETTARPQCFND